MRPATSSPPGSGAGAQAPRVPTSWGKSPRQRERAVSVIAPVKPGVQADARQDQVRLRVRHEHRIETAALHGDLSDGDHEPGDLCVFLRRMWRLLTPEQRLAFARDEEVHDTLEAVVNVKELLSRLPA